MGITLQTAEQSKGQAKVRLTLGEGGIVAFRKDAKPFLEQTLDLNAGENAEDHLRTGSGRHRRGGVLSAQVGFVGESRGGEGATDRWSGNETRRKTA